MRRWTLFPALFLAACGGMDGDFEEEGGDYEAEPMSAKAGAGMLRVSEQNNRFFSRELDGRTLEGPVYIFVGQPKNLKRVEFFLDDQQMKREPRRRDWSKPYDFVGNEPRGASERQPPARPFFTGSIRDGRHIISARLVLEGGGVREIHARFTVKSSQPGRWGEKAVTIPTKAFKSRGGPLSDGAALARVRSAPEIRLENAQANCTYPTDAQLKAFHTTEKWNNNQSYKLKVTGRPGRCMTTDELFQWAAHKWGISEDVLRAIVMNESGWYQSKLGDFRPVGPGCAPAKERCQEGGKTLCSESVGILQLRWKYRGKSTGALTQKSTPYNIDMMAGWLRGMVDGDTPGYATRAKGQRDPRYPDYKTSGDNDLMTCAASRFLGRWGTKGITSYYDKLKDRVSTRAWADSKFIARKKPTTCKKSNWGPT